MKLADYDGTRDPDEHVENVDNRMNYYNAHEAVKYKLFAITLIGATMTWYKTLLDGSTNSWENLCDSFTA